MSRWYLDENDRDIYFKDDEDVRWDYNQKEIVRILLGQDQQISDLQTKLKQQRKVLKDRRSKLRKRSSEIIELKHQLAEKEKEIEDVTIKHLDMLRYFIRHNSKQGIILSSDLEREIEEIEHGGKIWQTKNFTQDKISFHIDKLVELGEHFRNITKETNGLMKSADLVIYINNQIEQLTHQHEDKGE